MPSYKLFIVLFISLFLFIFLISPLKAHAKENAAVPPELGGPIVVCIPGIYPEDQANCTPVGPSEYLSRMADLGLTFPITPLPATRTDPSLAKVDTSYAEVRVENAPIYASIEDAMGAKKKQAVDRINSEFGYISYNQTEEINGKRFYKTEKGWMTANDVSRIGVLPGFQGLAFSRTPSNDFGWVLPFLNATPVETKRTPGSQAGDFTGHILSEYEVVQVFDIVNVDGSDWYMIAPDEWLPDKVVARVTPDSTTPSGVQGERWIAVNLDEQTMAVYDKHQLVFATVIASGADPFWTKPGLFQIYEKHESTPMRGAFGSSDAYYLEDVPWTMYYDQARALHGAYWRTKMGFTQSHGCVNMTVGDAHWLFNWANIGDYVYVWDPSGITPTDPSLYSSAGF